MTIDLTALSDDQRARICELLTAALIGPGDLRSAIERACAAGTADVALPETREDARHWAAVLGNLENTLGMDGDEQSPSRASAWVIHDLVAELRRHIRQIERARS
jgi:hypothetical protein